jgi:hypothetical protein
MRAAYPLLKEDAVSTRSFKGKMILMPFAFIMALLANVGVFTWQHPAEIQAKGSTCYNLIAAAAVNDWLYPTVNVVFVMMLAYDVCYDEHYERVRRGLPTPRPSWE